MARKRQGLISQQNKLHPLYRQTTTEGRSNTPSSYKFQERPTKTMKNVGEKHAILIGEPQAIDQRPPPHVAGARPKMVGKLHGRRTLRTRTSQKNKSGCRSSGNVDLCSMRGRHNIYAKRDAITPKGQYRRRYETKNETTSVCYSRVPGCRRCSRWLSVQRDDTV